MCETLFSHIRLDAQEAADYIKQGGVIECTFDSTKTADSPISKIVNGKSLEGGWAVLRVRTDKKANALRVANSIWETISAGDLREELMDCISSLSPQYF